MVPARTTFLILSSVSFAWGSSIEGAVKGSDAVAEMPSEPAVIFSGGGGSGASGKAILAGDKVALILVLTAGTGYTGLPTVVLEAPPKTLDVRLRWYLS